MAMDGLAPLLIKGANILSNGLSNGSKLNLTLRPLSNLSLISANSSSADFESSLIFCI